MSHRPIFSIGPDHHVPEMPECLFFGFFSVNTETRNAIPYASCEGYFFDLRRGKGNVLPYYATNIDTDHNEKADKIELVAVHPEGQLQLFPELVYKVIYRGGKERILWRVYIPTKWFPSLDQSVRDFMSFFPGVPFEINL